MMPAMPHHPDAFLGADPLDVLRATWGHAGFRGPQEDVVRSVVAGESLLLLLATGGGKSLCYQLPALVRPGLAIVVSPLVSLMDDQVSALRRAGVEADRVHGGMSPEEREETLRRARTGECKILYLPPERLLSPVIRALLRAVPLALVAVDECHVTSTWGMDFRPAYRDVRIFLRLARQAGGENPPPVVALTATADPMTLDDVRGLLGLRDSRLVRTGFDRPNIRISTRRTSGRRETAVLASNFVAERRGQAGVVYCSSRKETEAWANKLCAEGHHALPYHAGMTSENRAATHAAFSTPQGCVVVATIAFGMGIDRPGTRWVLHLGIPSSPEAWCQEIGRAGRDGLPAEALMLWSEGEIPRRRIMMERAAREADAAELAVVNEPAFEERWSEGAEGRSDHRRHARQRFEVMVAILRTAGCLRRSMLSYLDEDPGHDCGNCSTCLERPPVIDMTRQVEAVLALVDALDVPYGVIHLCDVLMGGVGTRIRTAGHDALAVFGVLRDSSRTEIAHVIMQCVAQGWLRSPPGGGGGYALTQSGAAALAASQAGDTLLFLSPPPEPAVLRPIGVPTAAFAATPLGGQAVEETFVAPAALVAPSPRDEREAARRETRRMQILAVLDPLSRRTGQPVERLLPPAVMERLMEVIPTLPAHLVAAGVPAATLALTGRALLVKTA